MAVGSDERSLKRGTDDAWRRVAPFKNVGAPVVRYLAEAECKRLVNATAASEIAGPIDMTAAGNFLYVQAGLASSVHVFAVKADGSLKLIQTQRVPHGASPEGIVAT